MLLLSLPPALFGLLTAGRRARARIRISAFTYTRPTHPSCDARSLGLMPDSRRTAGYYSFALAGLLRLWGGPILCGAPKSPSLPGRGASGSMQLVEIPDPLYTAMWLYRGVARQEPRRGRRGESPRPHG